MAVLFSASGIPEVKRFLGLAAQRGRNPRRTLIDIGEEMLVRNQRRLRRGVDVNGVAFKPSRRAVRDGGQTLWGDGKLGSSLHYDVGQSAGASALDLFSSDKRARVHYEGLTITPKNAQFLTIPMRARGGIFGDGDKGGAITGNRTGTRARHFKNAFFLRRGNRLFLMQRVGKELAGEKVVKVSRKSGSQRQIYDALRVLFMLVRSVKMPKREWMGFSNEDVDMAAAKLGGHVMGDTK
jgi:hypothetical protein